MPILIIPKKEGTVGFITHYNRTNQKLIRYPNPLPRIYNKMNQLK